MVTVLWAIIVVQSMVLVAFFIKRNTSLQEARRNADEWREVAEKAWEKTGAAEERRKTTDSVIEDFKRRIARL